jgi:hypothetical protein
MGIDRREMLTVVGGTEVLPGEGLGEPVEKEEIVYTLDTLPKSCIFTWEELYAAIAPHKAKILAGENREKYPARRVSQGACRSRARARVAARSDAG